MSHATADDKRVDVLCQRLNTAGIETWVDHQNGLIPGDHFNHKIQNAINSCAAGLFVLTPNSAASNYCEAEWMRLIALKIPFYVALLDSVPLSDFPLLLGTIQYADLVKGYDAGVNAMIRAIGGKIPLDAGDAAVKTGKRVTQNYDDRYSTYSIPMQGREADLAKALDDLKQAPLFIVGVGGLGKSRLAAEIVQVGDHTGAIWARVSDTSSAEEVIRLLREHYGLEAVTPPEKVIDRVRQDGRLLVVIDNAESISEAARPEFERLADQLALAKASVVVTTRVADWKTPYKKRSLEPSQLELKDAAKVVQAMVNELGIKRDTASFADDLAKAARLHPRLIELAVGKLKRRRSDEIIRELRELKSADTDKALTEMIGQNVTQMAAHDADAPGVLRRLAVCRGGFTFEAAQAIGGIDDEDALDARLNTLIDYNFVRFDGERFSIDDLVRLAVGEEEDARRVHIDYYQAHARAIGGNLTKHDRYLKLEIESENLDVAFAWILEINLVAAYWFAETCYEFLVNRGRFAHQMEWFKTFETKLANNTEGASQA
ncbi:MAG: TIR domain-containing protein, partial [Chloroflexota bacterium]